MKHILTKQFIEKFLLWLAVAVITAGAVTIKQTYSGAIDGTKAYKMSLENSERLDSVCYRVGLIELKIVHVYKSQDEITHRLERIDNKIDKIYEILITKK